MSQESIRQLNARIEAVAARRAIPAEVRPEAEAWMNRWLGGEAPEDLHAPAAADAVAYSVWHRVGPVEGGPAGFMRLHRDGLRFSGGDAERATECASETYLDVRERLEGLAERHRRGKSIPDFRQPWSEDERNAHRYHAIQLRLRLQRKWTRERFHQEYEDPRHSGDRGEWERPFRAAEARTYALTLHFAAWWMLLDVRERRSRDGRVKGRSWWWSMVQHALDVRRVNDLGGDRNDPTEALMRLRLRFSACQGLNPWLRVWASEHPYWNQVSFGLPDPDNRQAEAAARKALEQLRPALGHALAEMGLAAAEQRALEGTLIRGENVRTSTRHMAGDAPAGRLERMGALSESAGRLAAQQLLGNGGGANGGGGAGRGSGGGHEHPHALMEQLRSGMAPSPKDLATLNAAVRECPDCRLRWTALVEQPDYFDAVVQEQAMQPAPARARAGLSWVAAGALATALVLGVWALPTDSPDVGLRGAEATPAVHLDLVQRPSGAAETVRFDPTVPLTRGDTLYFSVSAEGSGEVRVWVEGPEGRAELGRQAVGTEATVLGEDFQATWYRVERAGVYTFSASSAPDGCAPETCVSRDVEVRP